MAQSTVVPLFCQTHGVYVHTLLYILFFTFPANTHTAFLERLIYSLHADPVRTVTATSLGRYPKCQYPAQCDSNTYAE